MEIYPIPRGFKITSETPCLTLIFSNPNRWSIIRFLLPCLLIIPGIYYNSIGLFYHFNFYNALVLICTIAVIGVLSFSFWNNDLGVTCGTTELRLDDPVLTINRQIFGISKLERIDRMEIVSFYQIRDDGFGKPNWSLKIKTNKGKRIYLVSRQPIEISDWLGRLLADRYQIEFIPTDYR